MDIAEKVSGIIKGLCGAEEIGKDDMLKEDLGLDSLTLVEAIAQIEDTFGISFDMGDLNPDELLQVSDLVALVEKAL